MLELRSATDTQSQAHGQPCDRWATAAAPVQAPPRQDDPHQLARVVRAAVITGIVWIAGSVALDVAFGPAIVVHSASGHTSLSGAVALVAGICIAVWFDRRDSSRPAAQESLDSESRTQSGPVAPTPRVMPKSTLGNQTSATKACPDCAEAVLAAARICRFCRYEFRPASQEQAMTIAGS